MGIEQLGAPLTLLGTFGGIWAVVRLFNKFQADFTERYRGELVSERDRFATVLTGERSRREEAEQDADTERRMRLASELETARLTRMLVQHGIDPRPNPAPGAPT